MNNLYEIKKIFGSDISLLNKKENYTVIDYGKIDGKGILSIYNLFKGVQLVFIDFKSETCLHSSRLIDNIFEINYCFEGRFECEFPNHTFTYLGEGDLAINSMENLAINSSFPLKIYYGICILIDMDVASSEINNLLNFFSISLNDIYNQLNLKENCYVCRSTSKIKHIFCELYENKEDIDINYAKIKLIELLHFFSTLSLENKYDVQYYTSNQVYKVKHIRDHIIEHDDRRFSLDKLTKEHEISLTLFKRCFKEIYGDTPYSYVRKYKMNKAALMLRLKNININEIAISLGYKNASKFSEAFKSVMGTTPSEYRKKINDFLEQDNPFRVEEKIK
ncbi:AraC family transcriptional regulator [Clostridium botulinum]|uniref:AraC family transcriptional regulator n=1 Tax=Clostridium botulinum TaxID=1491 RepID=A0A6M0SSP5_CLOBO|nr:AraC family transcriptional regulator [Clostridium botulinum]NFO11000.1 helix-turn-helix transcriptional regulator [Clostridium botulinum]NFO15735.1 helix-turn-helix transcriptional regulator [Clostridium botulinum]